jgi:hypothetical protein
MQVQMFSPVEVRHVKPVTPSTLIKRRLRLARQAHRGLEARGERFMASCVARAIEEIRHDLTLAVAKEKVA